MAVGPVLVVGCCPGSGQMPTTNRRMWLSKHPGECDTHRHQHPMKRVVNCQRGLLGRVGIRMAFYFQQLPTGDHRQHLPSNHCALPRGRPWHIDCDSVSKDAPLSRGPSNGLKSFAISLMCLQIMRSHQGVRVQLLAFSHIHVPLVI